MSLVGPFQGAQDVIAALRTRGPESLVTQARKETGTTSARG
jgi:hypothetical protein